VAASLDVADVVLRTSGGKAPRPQA